MLSIFKKTIPSYKYTKKNIQSDIWVYNAILQKYCEKLESYENITGFISWLNQLVFVAVDTNDRHIYEDEKEKTMNAWLEFKKEIIKNIEDYIILILQKFHLNAECFWSESILIKQNIEISYFYYVWLKRKFILEKANEFTIEYPFFDILYQKPFLNWFFEVNEEKLDTDYIMKVAERSKELNKDYSIEIASYLEEIIKENLKSTKHISHKYVTSFLFYLNKNLEHINNNYIASTYTDVDYFLSYEKMISSKFFPAIELEKEDIKITVLNWWEEVRKYKKIVVFTTFETILNRFKTTSNINYFKGYIDSLNKQETIFDFKLITTPQYLSLMIEMDKVHKTFNFLQNKETISETQATNNNIWKWEAKKNFDNLLLHAIKGRGSDIYLKESANGEYGSAVIRNSRWVLIEEFKYSMEKFKQMRTVILEDAKINTSVDFHKPKSGKNVVTVYDYTDNNREYKDQLRLEYVSGNIYIRRLNKEAKVLTLEQLWYPIQDIVTINNWYETNSNWLILVCGPTGSGKTTLMYTILEEQLRKRKDVHLLTAEDPVERKIPLFNIEQNEVTPSTTYFDYCKSFLRADPDWILIWETRDNEVLTELLKASETGHLTSTTLHTNNTVASLDRMVKLYTNGDLNLYSFSKDLILQSLRWIVNVKLLKKLCPHCKKQITKQDIYSRIIKKWFSKEDAEKYVWNCNPDTLFSVNHEWCEHCEKTGYSWKIQWIMEIMDLSNKQVFRNVSNGDYSDIIPLFDKWFVYVSAGIVDIDELVMKT